MNKHKTPSNENSSMDNEINTIDYPFYRYIPLDVISEKQKKMIGRYKVAQIINQEPYYSVPEPEPLPERNSIVSTQSPVEPVAQFSIVEEEGGYRFQMKSLEERLEDLKNEVDKNEEIIESQKNEINDNYRKLEDQGTKIVSTNSAIQSNNNFIQQQLQAYAHNTNVLQQQVQYANSYAYHIASQKEELDKINNEIEQKQSQLTDLETQLTDLQSQIDSSQQQLDSYQQQLYYHGSMLTAFNTLIQNPQYFSQLMSVASGYGFDQQSSQTIST